MGHIDDVAVARALRALVDDDLCCGARAVWDAPLHPGERVLAHGVVDRVRHQTATGRLLLREVLRAMGVSPGPILRAAGGRPDLPIGITGTLAHDDEVAVCVCAAGNNLAIGVDVEPALPLPAEILDDVATSDRDREAVMGDDGAVDLVKARLLFCAKEAVYKACFPLDEVFLEFKDVSVVEGVLPGLLQVQTSTGRRLLVKTLSAPRLLAFARVRFT